MFQKDQGKIVRPKIANNKRTKKEISTLDMVSFQWNELRLVFFVQNLEHFTMDLPSKTRDKCKLSNCSIYFLLIYELMCNKLVESSPKIVIQRASCVSACKKFCNMFQWDKVKLYDAFHITSHVIPILFASMPFSAGFWFRRLLPFACVGVFSALSHSFILVGYRHIEFYDFKLYTTK